MSFVFIDASTQAYYNHMASTTSTLASATHDDYHDRIVFVGSSIFAFWETLADDMRGLPVINNAVPGYVNHELYRTIEHLTRGSRVTVVYCGSNDIRCGFTPARTAERMRGIAELVAMTPEAQLIIVGSEC